MASSRPIPMIGDRRRQLQQQQQPMGRAERIRRKQEKDMARLSRSAPVHSWMPPAAPVIRPRRNSELEPVELELPQPLSLLQEKAEDDDARQRRAAAAKMPKVLSVYNSWRPAPFAMLLAQQQDSPSAAAGGERRLMLPDSPDSGSQSNNPQASFQHQILQQSPSSGDGGGGHRSPLSPSSASGAGQPGIQSPAASPQAIAAAASAARKHSFNSVALGSTPTIFSLLQGRSLNKVSPSQSRSNLSAGGDSLSNYDPDLATDDTPVAGLSRRESLDLQFDFSLEDALEDEEEGDGFEDSAAALFVPQLPQHQQPSLLLPGGLGSPVGPGAAIAGGGALPQHHRHHSQPAGSPDPADPYHSKQLQNLQAANRWNRAGQRNLY